MKKFTKKAVCWQEINPIWAKIERTKRDPDLTKAQKKNRLEGLSAKLYKVSGKAKLPGIVEQIERALDEGIAAAVKASHVQ